MLGNCGRRNAFAHIGVLPGTEALNDSEEKLGVQAIWRDLAGFLEGVRGFTYLLRCGKVPGRVEGEQGGQRVGVRGSHDASLVSDALSPFDSFDLSLPPGEFGDVFVSQGGAVQERRRRCPGVRRRHERC
ncbi:hypothetical protein [Streptomyces sp. NPDC057889]|uniref:hypothetical protein n=1 Tax=unclassified Streptomyces TaxID=2593676 RepID=UPI0036B4A381